MRKWDMDLARLNSDKETALLEDGWEPFGVVLEGSKVFVFFRRLVGGDVSERSERT